VWPFDIKSEILLVKDGTGGPKPALMV
jgi:hypothetical protein